MRFLFIFYLLIFSSVCFSIELGKVQVLSHLHEPLDVIIPINPIHPNIQIGLADKQAHLSAGLEPPSYLERIQVNLNKDGIRLRTIEPIEEVFLQLLIQSKEKDAVSLLPITLLIDPLTEKTSMQKKIEKLEKEVTSLNHLLNQQKENTYTQVAYQTPRITSDSLKLIITLWNGLDCEYWILAPHYIYSKICYKLLDKDKIVI